MERIAKFYLVSKKQFCADYDGPGAETVYETLKLPKRATAGSAGYDFYAPVDVELLPGEGVKLPTGIRAEIAEGWVLLLFPRSSLGFKYRLQMDNTTGVIDSDYFGAENEGHIFVKLTNDGDKPLRVEAGQGLFQGIFVPFGITADDDAAEKRVGGMGSTTK